MTQRLTAEMITLNERSKTQLALDEIRARWAKIKGKYFVVPGVLPHTEVFVRKGKHPDQVINRVKSHMEAFRENFMNRF